MVVVEDDVWILANFKETQLERMQIGQPVDITIDAMPHHKFSGRVDSLQPGTGSDFALLPPDNATGNFIKIVQRVPVKILFDPNSIANVREKIVPGLSRNPASPSQRGQHSCLTSVLPKKRPRHRIISQLPKVKDNLLRGLCNEQAPTSPVRLLERQRRS